MLRRVATAAVLGGTLIFILTAHLSADTRTVEKPMFNGNRLDWCANWGADCGKPAAEAWCVAQGFAGVASFERAPRIGDKSPTRLIATGAVCDEAKCDGFKAITCVKLDTVEPGSPSASAGPALPDPPARPVEASAVVDGPQPVAAASPAPEGAPAGSDPAPLSVPEAEAAAAALPVPRSEARAVAETEGDTPGEIRAVTPESATDDAMTTGATPVETAAAVAEAPGDDDDGPPPPDTWLLAAAGAPPLRPVLEVFAAPTFNGRRLDWCRGWKDRCGKATADEFCQLNGFVEALSFAPDPKIGAAQPTRQIASGLVCDHDGCDGFAEIACTK